MLKETVNLFKNVYQINPKSTYFSPGRVNIIGEYTDLAGGLVLPAALTIGAYAAVLPRKDKIVRFYSGNVGKSIITSNLDNMPFLEADGWANYLKGMFVVLKEYGIHIPHGFDICINGNLPNGAGLSSSACIEVLMGKIILTELGIELSNIELVKLAQKCENQYVGVNCGIMDQFAVCFGKENTAIMIDTNSLEYNYTTLPLDKYELIIMNTNKRRSLQESKYNVRKAEVAEAVENLSTVINFDTLCHLTLDEFLQNKDVIKNKNAYKRALHLVSENKRVKDAYKALQGERFEEFFDCIDNSHTSLKNDFEVTGFELDTIVSLAKKHGALGARMTGAGFGGCAIMFVKKGTAEDIKEKIRVEYESIVGYAPTFYDALLGEGTRKLS